MLFSLLFFSTMSTTTASDNTDASVFHQVVSSLVGTWKGEGTVDRRPISAAPVYSEVLEIRVVRQTPEFVVLHWFQDTKNTSTGKPMHTETGFLKVLNREEPGAARSSGMESSTNLSFKVEAGFTHPFPPGLATELSKGTLLSSTTSDDNQTSVLLSLESHDFCRANASPDEDKDDHILRHYIRGYKVVERKQEGGVPQAELSYVQYFGKPGDTPHLQGLLTKEEN
jgi:hypothetical protein